MSLAMRLALIFRSTRRLLMPINQDTPRRAFISSHHSLKRRYSHSASNSRADLQSESTTSHYPPTSKYSHRSSRKAAKVEGSSQPVMPFSSSSRSAKHNTSRSSSKRSVQKPSKKNDAPSRNPPKALDLPKRDVEYIMQTFKQVNVLSAVEENPKNFLVNYAIQVLGKTLSIQTQQGVVGKEYIYRSSISVGTEPQICGEGDDANKKEAERLACLSAIYQVISMGWLEPTGKLRRTAAEAAGFASGGAVQATLSDGTTVVGYETARQFVDFYCRRYAFGKEELTATSVNSKHGTLWETVMTIGGRRIGIGKGTSKKLSQQSCYVDVTQYLESCDIELWRTYAEAARTGKDLGLAPSVFCHMTDALEDEIYDLCYDVKKSALYRNASKSTAVNSVIIPSPDQVPAPTPRRMHMISSLEEKSSRLMERRKEYLTDPSMERMRAARAHLPVTTRSPELLKHIQDNEVTICMAATGSGKTTQIPQLILDDWIEKGVGANCNIVCTQPRRIAAISVADRVAKERGETLGKSVGYQVRFETKLPDDHGSITFCTTGIFLKRMQTALLEGSASIGRSLDDVTHIVVDEVHERDVDTDLLLVVLKRLLADRKAKNKPIKVVLMSATIDPTLFQNYFPDEVGRPAQVIDIPGRAFPVQKNFMDDFIPELYRTREARWVFAQESVVKYLQNELDPVVLQTLRKGNTGYSPISFSDRRETKPDDLELPYPLISATISHVLRSSDSGHVLVFLPGWEDIMSVQRCLLDTTLTLGLDFGDKQKWEIHLLHSTIPLPEQQRIFEPPPERVRRIILATNIAETSVTIPDVVYVVDTAKVKELRFDPDRHVTSLVSAWVGSSNLNQRAGRAGRHRPGQYFGILGQKRASELQPYQTVEMKRVDLSNIVMHVKALNFPGMTVEEVLAATIEPPDAGRVAAAMNDLRMVGALDSQQNLTSLGRVLLQLPVEVQMGRLVLFGSFFKCLDQALTLAAILTNRDPFVSPMHLKREASRVKNSWTPHDFRSDALAILRAYNGWSALHDSGDYFAANRFCSNNFLSKPTLLLIHKIKGHLLQALYHAGVLDVSAGSTIETFGRRKEIVVPPELDANGGSLPLLAALIAIASQPKFAIRTGERSLRTAQDKLTFIHPSSVNSRNSHESTGVTTTSLHEKQIIAFAEKRQNISMLAPGEVAQKFLVTTTVLDPMSYMLFGAFNVKVTERGLECDDWLPIIGNVSALDQISRLKEAMDVCMLRVFEGITMARRNRHGRVMIVPRQEEREEESEDDDDDPKKVQSLTSTEIVELDVFTRDIVRILNRYSQERTRSRSRGYSRPATPSSPNPGSRGPGLRSGQSTPTSTTSGSSVLRISKVRSSRSGQSTPFIGSAYNSRPGTPSRLRP